MSNIMLNEGYRNLLLKKVSILNKKLSESFDYETAFECLRTHNKISQMREEPIILTGDENFSRIVADDIKRLLEIPKRSATQNVQLYYRERQLEHGCVQPMFDVTPKYINLLEEQLTEYKMKEQLYTDELLKVNQSIKIFYLCDKIESAKKSLDMGNKKTEFIKMGAPDLDYAKRKVEKLKELLSLLKRKLELLRKRTDFKDELERVNNEIDVLNLKGEIEAKELYLKTYKREALEVQAEGKLNKTRK